MQVVSLVTQSERTNQLAADVRDGRADILTLCGDDTDKKQGIYCGP